MASASMLEFLPLTRMLRTSAATTADHGRSVLEAGLVSQGSSYIPSLDGIRALSFACVFFAHAGVPGVPGLFGVTVFFFLSGFLITTLLRREVTKTGGVSLKHFYLRRVLRILPPFYLILLAATLLAGLGISGSGFGYPAVIAQALHYANYWIVTHGFQGFPPGTGVYWSLAVEEHFYLIFPWIFVGLMRLGLSAGRKTLILLAICGLSLAWRLWLVHGLHVNIDRTSVATDTRFDSIMFGCALAMWENPVLDRTQVSERVWKLVLLPVALVVMLLTFVIRSDTFRETFRYTLQGLALVPLFVCAMRYPDWLPMRVLNWRPVAFVGTLSYSLYLVHQVVLASVETQLHGLGMWPTAAISLVLSGVISLGIYYAVEKPCAELRRRLQA